MPFLKRFLRALPLLLISPVLMVLTIVILAISDLLHALVVRDHAPDAGAGHGPAPQSASVVIPNWNGKDLLAKYLPSVIEAMRGNPANEIIVVDNGSTDGSADFVLCTFP